MDQPQNFGQFLLFQKSESNSYRSCYRAGVTRGRAIERIIRLEVLDQPDIDAERVLSGLESSASLQEKLKDPHIAAGAGVGQVEGSPYAAYDFKLGTTLSAFLSAARRRSFPVPFDQALFIGERIALALAAAYRIEHDDRHVLHTFLTPDSVLLSNEGEVKVGGFEFGRALRDQLAGRPFCAPYLSPKCRAGQAPLDQDDVFSLGSILYELVTGEILAVEKVDLDRMVVQATGEPAPESLRLLLEGSFAPTASRIPHVMAWQQSLGRLILDGEYNPTTFNLAFLMHTLLRDELERGVEDLKKEKRYVLPQPRESESTEEATAEISTTLSSVTEVPDEVEEPDAELAPGDHDEPTATGVEAPSWAHAAEVSGIATESADRRPFWLGFAVSVVAAGAVLGALLVFGSSAEESATSPLAAPANATTRLPQVEETSVSLPEPPSTDPGEAEGSQAQSAPVVLSEVVNGEVGQPLDEEEVRRVVAERAEEIERTLKAEYEQQLESLRSEIIESRERELAAEMKAAPPEEVVSPFSEATRVTEIASFQSGLQGEGTPETPPTDAVNALPQPAGTEQVAPAPSGALAARDESLTPAQRDPAARAAAATENTPLETQNAANQAMPAPEPSAPAPSPVAPKNQAPTPDELVRLSPPRQTAKPTATAPKPAAQAPSPAAAKIRPPTPVTAKIQAPTPVKLVRLTPPTYPPAARRLQLSATARVKVLISPQGRVREAEVLGPPLGSGFDNAAIAAVRRSRWQPATKNGEPVESWTTITIQFQP